MTRDKTRVIFNPPPDDMITYTCPLCGGGMWRICDVEGCSKMMYEYHPLVVGKADHVVVCTRHTKAVEELKRLCRAARACLYKSLDGQDGGDGR